MPIASLLLIEVPCIVYTTALRSSDDGESERERERERESVCVCRLQVLQLCVFMNRKQLDYDMLLNISICDTFSATYTRMYILTHACIVLSTNIVVKHIMGCRLSNFRK